MNSKISIPFSPIGIKTFHELPEWTNEISPFMGISFCQAVNQASQRKSLLVKLNGIETCKWSRVILGLKPIENEFENSLSPRLQYPIKGVFVAPVAMFPDHTLPDVVIIRGEVESLQKLIGSIGWENTAMEYASPRKYSVSALLVFKNGNPSKPKLLMVVNGILRKLKNVPGWTPLTAVVFKSLGITRLLEFFIKRFMATMSVCRNSTVIPLLTGKVNASFFCTGGISWGDNDPKFMTSGWPYDLYLKIKPLLEMQG